MLVFFKSLGMDQSRVRRLVYRLRIPLSFSSRPSLERSVCNRQWLSAQSRGYSAAGALERWRV